MPTRAPVIVMEITRTTNHAGAKSFPEMELEPLLQNDHSQCGFLTVRRSSTWTAGV